jgi:hypothetical protein
MNNFIFNNLLTSKSCEKRTERISKFSRSNAAFQQCIFKIAFILSSLNFPSSNHPSLEANKRGS